MVGSSTSWPVREHRRTRGLGPDGRIVHELAPESVGTLVAEQPGHHLAEAGEDAFAVRVVHGQALQEHRRAGCHPAVAARPRERRAGAVVEEAVRALHLVEVEQHLVRGALRVDAPLGLAERVELEDRDHEHVVHPEARLRRVAALPQLLALLVAEHAVDLLVLRLRLRPLRVRHREPLAEGARVARVGVDRERQAAEHGVVHVVGGRAAGSRTWSCPRGWRAARGSPTRRRTCRSATRADCAASARRVRPRAWTRTRARRTRCRPWGT